jgi:regulator of replication initiation timing
MSGDTKQRISDLEAELAMARQRVTELMNENKHLRDGHPTLRDQFAMAALTGIIVRFHGNKDSYAQYAYDYADVLMEERNAKY